MRILVNERDHDIESGQAVGDLRRSFKPDADLMIVNGHPVPSDTQLCEGDQVVLIRRGEIPGPEELESLMVARHGPGIHERVKRARVGVAGCGGLGSAVAIALARTGVGRLRIIDFDVVEPSNLNRQQYFIEQIGRPKVEALADNLSRINPYVQVEQRNVRLTLENSAAIFAGCDVVAECFDDPRAKRDLTLAMRRSLPEVPLVAVSGIAGVGSANSIRSRRAMHNLWLVGDGDTAARAGARVACSARGRGGGSPGEFDPSPAPGRSDQRRDGRRGRQSCR